jgi:hypothetical protein
VEKGGRKKMKGEWKDEGVLVEGDEWEDGIVSVEEGFEATRLRGPNPSSARLRCAELPQQRVGASLLQRVLDLVLCSSGTAASGPL